MRCDDKLATARNDLSDARGIPVSYSNKEAIVALENAHESFLAFHGDPLEMVNTIIERHPDFMLAHLFKAACLTQTIENRVRDDLVNTVSAAEALSATATDRELAHLRAVSAWITGDVSAAVTEWENALAHNPLDLLALQIIHLTYVLFGQVKGQRDVVARVFTYWDESIVGYEHVLGFYAFGLEENGEYERAEQMAKRSISLRSENPYAVHAIVHIMDMQGRYREGLAFMYDHAERWTASGFTVHLWWHTALMHLDLQDFERVLEIYDSELRASQDTASLYEEFDATALLWRLRLLGVDVGDRWIELADKWEPSAKDTLYAFNNAHAMMALVSDSRHIASQVLLETNDRYARESSNDNAVAIRTVGLLFCHAIKDFHENRYAECVDRLLAVRHQLDHLGGSYVQREVLIWTMFEASIRAGRYALAVALANERCELKPGSVQRWLDLARGLHGLGDMSASTAANDKAAVILAEHNDRSQTLES
ncbi:MAG: tetratricopeptide repeat protein [Woeseia sp.]|jgi:tetratricopeptide (TPR) repeat protein|nr:tetratricopeptide repeat protein [Woeseia sp.]